MDKELLIKGKAKNVYLNDKDSVIIEYTNRITAFNNKRKDLIVNKGKINCKISNIIFQRLIANGIKTHFIKEIDETTILCKKVNIIPLEVIVRNYAKGSIVKKLGIKEYFQFKEPIIEFSLKNDALNDPLISERQIIGLDIISKKELVKVIDLALKVNEVLKKIFSKHNITLLDFKIEFGKDKDNEIILADEISPDCMRLENLKTKTKYDKDVYRQKLGNVMDGYNKILEVLDNGKK